MSQYITVLTDVTPWIGLNSQGLLLKPEGKTNDPALTFTTADVGGFLTITALGTFASPIEVSDRVFIKTSIGSGYLPFDGKVTAWNSSTQTITTDIAWQSIMSACAFVQVLHSPIIQIYVGHNSTDPFPNDLPYGLLAEIQPEWYLAETEDGYWGQIVLNGYLRSIFDAVAPVNGGTNFSLFNKVRLIYDGNLLAVANVAYSMLTDIELSSIAAVNGYLTSYDGQPAVFSCGQTILTKIDGVKVYEVEITNGEFELADVFNNDFNNDFA